MNRRSFFRLGFGAVAGVFAAPFLKLLPAKDSATTEDGYQYVYTFKNSRGDVVYPPPISEELLEYQRLMNLNLKAASELPYLWWNADTEQWEPGPPTFKVVKES